MQHGGDLSEAMRQYGGRREDWLDLSTGINPWPWSIPVALAPAYWQNLPAGDDIKALIAAARVAYDVPDRVAIVPAAGTQAIIQWLPWLAAAGPVAIVGPTYTEHGVCWSQAGRDVVDIASLDRVPDSVRHAVVVNPNNPGGRITERGLLAEIASRLRRRGGWLVVDESFADLDPDISAAGLAADLPLVILRSFGKFFGLAGLRLGFALAAPDIAERLSAALGPWNVSGPALMIGREALADLSWAVGTRERLSLHAAALDRVIEGAGLTIAGGTALFRLARHPDAHRLHDALARRRIWVRRFSWASDLLRFGLPPDQAALNRFSAALAAAD